MSRVGVLQSLKTVEVTLSSQAARNRLWQIWPGGELSVEPGGQQLMAGSSTVCGGCFVLELAAEAGGE